LTKLAIFKYLNRDWSKLWNWICTNKNSN